MEAGQSFDSLNVNPDFNADTATAEQTRRYVNSVRSAFFDLPSLERSLLLVEQRTLAVNLVSNWEWTPDAIAAGIPKSGTTYRILGNKESIDRHQIYVNAGYVRPLEPSMRIRRIIGTYFRAKEDVAKSIYSSTANQVNEHLWENVVSEKTKELLQSVLDDQPEETAALGVRTIRELWDRWSALEPIFEQRIAQGVGMDETRSYSRKKDEQTPYDKLRTFIKVPEEEIGWGTDWPGVDPGELSRQFSNVTLERLDPDALRAAEALGLELRPGMSGQEIFAVAQAGFVEIDSPVRLTVDPTYRSYVGELGATGAAAENTMRKLAFNQTLEPEFNTMVQDFMMFEMQMEGRYRGSQYGVPTMEALEVQGRFMTMAETGADTKPDWDLIWRMRYERTYGVLGWEAPTPPGVTENSYVAAVHRVVDGDTLVVRPRVGDNQGITVRLLGTRSRDFGLDNEGASDDKDRLVEALHAGIRAGLEIQFVRQPEIYGNVDPYGRELAWLYIGGEPFFFPEELDPRRDPGGES